MAQHLVTQVSQDSEKTSNSCPLCWWLCCCFSHDSGHSGNPGIEVGSLERGKYLLPDLPDGQTRKRCLVLDLDETLVHSSFKPIPDADFRIEIELEGTIHRVYVRKRPFVDEFLKDVGKKWEVVIFTASLAKYADPLLDILDRDRVVSSRLFREGCVQHYGNYVKDMSLMGRPLDEIVIIDNSPFSYMFQPDNAIPITSWFTDRSDTELRDLLPFLDQLLTVESIPATLPTMHIPFLGNQESNE